MELSLEQHIYGATRLITLILSIIAGGFMLFTYYKKRRLPALCIGTTILMMMNLSIYTVVEYFLLLSGNATDVTPLVYFSTIVGNFATVPWSILPVSIDKRWKYAFFATIIIDTLIAVNIAFLGQLVISRNNIGYTTHSYTTIVSILLLMTAIIALIIGIYIMKVGTAERKSERGFTVFLIGLVCVLTIIVEMLWLQEILHDILAVIFIAINTILLLMSEHPPKRLLKLWIKQ